MSVTETFPSGMVVLRTVFYMSDFGPSKWPHFESVGTGDLASVLAMRSSDLMIDAGLRF